MLSTPPVPLSVAAAHPCSYAPILLTLPAFTPTFSTSSQELLILSQALLLLSQILSAISQTLLLFLHTTYSSSKTLSSTALFPP